jgi:small subunit ribosomal protein S1
MSDENTPTNSHQPSETDPHGSDRSHSDVVDRNGTENGTKKQAPASTNLEEDPAKIEAERAAFAKMLDQYGSPDRGETPPVGTRVKGRLIQIGEEHSFVDFGGRSEGMVETRLLKQENGELAYKVGDSIELTVIADQDQVLLGTSVQIEAGDALRVLREARQQGLPVSGKVIALNAGGLEVQVSGQRGFCPFSQVEIGYCSEPSAYIGQTLEFLVEQIEEKGKSVNLVLSRRALLARAESKRAEELLSTLKPGAEIEGTVTRLQPFGAFVDLGGIEGLVHVSEIRYGRTEQPSDVLKVGQRVRVRVLGMEQQEKRLRISLSIKAATPDPWDDVTEQFWEGKKTNGTVVRLTNFGAFVELTPGIEGLVHVSEIAHRPITDPSDVLKTGQNVDVTVLKVEPERRRVSLSIRDREPAPAVEEGAIDSPAERQPKTGDVVDAVVRSIKPYGIFADLPIYGPRVSGLIPREETGEKRDTDLSKRFQPGTPLKVTIIDVTGDGKIRLSLTAQQVMEERRGFDEFRAKTSASRGGGTSMEEAFKRAMKSGS